MTVKNPYTYPHRSRRAKSEYICSIGGYYSRDGRFPIEFTVGTYYADFSFDHIWEKYAAECWPFDESKTTPDKLKAYYDLAKRLHSTHETFMWGWGQEDAARSLQEDDAHRMLWDGTSLDVELELHGRGGKHLVIRRFEGRTLLGQTEDDLLADMMRQVRPDGYAHTEYDKLRPGNYWEVWSDKDITLLYKYVRQCVVDFTSQKASEEVEYQGATCFFHNIVNAEFEQTLEDLATHDEAVEAARAVQEVMGRASASGEERTYFATLCAAAGITQSELE